MTEQLSNDLENPKDDRAPDGQRQDGRPSVSSLDQAKSELDPEQAPTEPPEETGATPTTEHAPGGDL